MRILYDETEEAHPCPYLPDQMARMHCQLVEDLSAAEYQDLMQLKFRKFGKLIFRPVCEQCSACMPLRVDVQSFSPDRSMKRCLAINRDIVCEYGFAENSLQRVALFNRYHSLQSLNKKWQHSEIDLNQYSVQFMHSDIAIEEIRLNLDGVLAGVLLFEDLPAGLSLIYHYYDSALRNRSLGTFLILKTLELARLRARQFVYLGYFVNGCSSMMYKARYRPNQLLKEGSWCRP